MKLNGQYDFEAPIDVVWNALLDPEALASVMPGCDKLEIVDGQYRGALNIKVGPVQGKFQGLIDLENVRAEEGYTIKVNGKGTQGFVKATAEVSLESQDDAKTTISYDADAKVGGRVASVGQRLLDATAKAIIKQSLDGLNETVKYRAHVAQQAAQAESGVAEDGLAPDEAPTLPLPPKQMSQAAFAAGVAKEVTKSLVPPPVLVGGALVLAAVVAVVLVQVLG